MMIPAAENDTPRLITEARLYALSLDTEPNAWGETVHVIPPGEGS